MKKIKKTKVVEQKVGKGHRRKYTIVDYLEGGDGMYVSVARINKILEKRPKTKQWLWENHLKRERINQGYQLTPADKALWKAFAKKQITPSEFKRYIAKSNFDLNEILTQKQ